MNKLNILIYIFLFPYSFGVWFYCMAIASDIPVDIATNEFIKAEILIILLFVMHLFLLSKGRAFPNIITLLVPNVLWLFDISSLLKYRYHIYHTIITISIVLVLLLVLIMNIFNLHRRQPHQ